MLISPSMADAPGAPRQWWFGGGTDLTPSYIFEEDVKHFHSVNSFFFSLRASASCIKETHDTLEEILHF